VSNTKPTVFCHTAPCCHVKVDSFRGAYCLFHQGDDNPDDERSMHFKALTVEAVGTSETSVNFYVTAQHNIPEHCHLCYSVVWTTESTFNKPRIYKVSCKTIDMVSVCVCKKNQTSTEPRNCSPRTLFKEYQSTQKFVIFFRSMKYKTAIKTYIYVLILISQVARNEKWEIIQ
jgi:hypothetical protein